MPKATLSYKPLADKLAKGCLKTEIHEASCCQHAHRPPAGPWGRGRACLYNSPASTAPSSCAQPCLQQTCSSLQRLRHRGQTQQVHGTLNTPHSPSLAVHLDKYWAISPISSRLSTFKNAIAFASTTNLYDSKSTLAAGYTWKHLSNFRFKTLWHSWVSAIYSLVSYRFLYLL